MQCPAVRVHDASAGRNEDRMTGSDIPIVRRGESRVEVGGALGEPAEFHR